MGPTWGLHGSCRPRPAPWCWPHEPWYQAILHSNGNTYHTHETKAVEILQISIRCKTSLVMTWINLNPNSALKSLPRYIHYIYISDLYKNLLKIFRLLFFITSINFSRSWAKGQDCSVRKQLMILVILKISVHDHIYRIKSMKLVWELLGGLFDFRFILLSEFRNLANVYEFPSTLLFVMAKKTHWIAFSQIWITHG